MDDGKWCAAPRRACWATLVTDAQYLPGLVVLAHSLALHESLYPLVVMVTEQVDDATRVLMARLGCTIREVPAWNVATGDQLAHSRVVHVYTKLRAFELVEYDRVVLVDTDMLVMRNMDELMELELAPDTIAASPACTCNPNRIPTYPADWTPTACAYAAHARPLALTHTSPRTHHLLNSGLVVLRPSIVQMHAMGDFVEARHDHITQYRFPDQDLLADVYAGRYIPLPWYYNALKTLRRCHADMWQDDAIRNVHYILEYVSCHALTQQTMDAGAAVRVGT